MTRVALPDAEAVADLATFVGRAGAIAPTGSVRLVGAGQVLACYVGILDGTGLFGEGLVIGLRVLELASPLEADVALTSERLLQVLDTLDGATTLDVEPDPVPPRWTAQSPPRSGWQEVDTLDAGVLHEAARSKDVRAQVAGLPDGVTHGVALALRGLGLLTGTPVRYRAGGWQRVSTSAGHVVTR